MSLRYSMLVVDLDGTLLGPDGVVSAVNVAAVERARAAGLEVVVATGRAHVESGAALAAIGCDGRRDGPDGRDGRPDGRMVAAGGSMLCDVVSGRAIERHVIPHALIAEVAEVLLAHDHKVLLLKDPAVGYDYLAVGPAELDPASQWWFETLPVRVRFVHMLDDDPHPHDTVRAGVVASEGELAPIAAWLRESLGERVFLQHWAAVTRDGGGSTHLLEVFMPYVDKWTMIERCCRQDGIPTERVAAIGDGLNDVQLIAGAGLGIAMGNADPRVRAVADRLTEHHDADGVAKAIDRLLDGRW